MSRKIFMQDELFDIAEDMTGKLLDHRFRSWAKWIDSVDPKGKDGFAFTGAWINEGTNEVEIGTPRLILVKFRHGSMNYNYAEYAVIKLAAEGELEPTDIMASQQQDGKGWALRIRDTVFAALAYMADEDKTPVTISHHLGTGEKGRRRKAALLALAEKGGFFHNGIPSIGKMLVKMADDALRG